MTIAAFPIIKKRSESRVPIRLLVARGLSEMLVQQYSSPISIVKEEVLEFDDHCISSREEISESADARNRGKEEYSYSFIH
jgi:hypothetical protein